MGITKIEWTAVPGPDGVMRPGFTFNPWWGCQKIAPECEHCYADTFAHRLGLDLWGPTAPRRFFGEKHWAEPYRWNALAQREGIRRRVFCASMADVFEDRRELVGPRNRLWQVICETPFLDWLLLTKRPENVVAMSQWSEPWPDNVWVGASAGTQQRFEEVGESLSEIPARVRFLSAEPLLGPVHIGSWWQFLDWVIVGAESGAGARPMPEEWVRYLRDQCADASIPFFYKQAAAGGRKVSLPLLDGRQHVEFPEVRHG